jgi:hypothetical protein
MDESLLAEIDRARTLTGEQKIRESLQIFERNSRLMLDGLRNEFSQLSEDQLRLKLYERLAINREIQDLPTSR